MDELTPNQVDELRRVAKAGKIAKVLALPPTALSLGAAAELACWIGSDQELRRGELGDHFRHWAREQLLLREAVSALWGRRATLSAPTSSPMAFLSCFGSGDAHLGQAKAIEDFGASFVNAAVLSCGFERRWSTRLWVCIQELVDNIAIHSRVLPTSPQQGLIGYRAGSDSLEIVAGDVGQGILASLTSNSSYRHIKNEREALHAVVREHASASRPRGQLGGGLRSIFAHIASRAGEVRFRSGDRALGLVGSFTEAEEVPSASPALAGLQVYIKLKVPVVRQNRP